MSSDPRMPKKYVTHGRWNIHSKEQQKKEIWRVITLVKHANNKNSNNKEIKKTHCPKNSKKEAKVRIRRRFYLKQNRLVICEYQSRRTKITYELNQDVETEDLARKNEVDKIKRKSFTSREWQKGGKRCFIDLLYMHIPLRIVRSNVFHQQSRIHRRLRKLFNYHKKEETTLPTNTYTHVSCFS